MAFQRFIQDANFDVRFRVFVWIVVSSGELLPSRLSPCHLPQRGRLFFVPETFPLCQKAPSVRGLSPLGDWGSSPKYFCIGSFLSITVFQGPSCELFSIICHSIGKSFSPYSVHFICRISILWFLHSSFIVAFCASGIFAPKYILDGFSNQCNIPWPANFPSASSYFTISKPRFIIRRHSFSYAQSSSLLMAK